MQLCHFQIFLSGIFIDINHPFTMRFKILRLPTCQPRLTIKMAQDFLVFIDLTLHCFRHVLIVLRKRLMIGLGFWVVQGLIHIHSMRIKLGTCGH